MTDWAARLYIFFRPRRILLGGLTLSLLGLSFYATSGLEMDKGLAALWPDSSPTLKRTAELMDLAPFSRLMLLQLSAEEGRATANLAPAADELIAGLDPGLMRALDLAGGLPGPEGLMNILPALCDRECLTRVTAESAPEAWPRALAELKGDLAGPSGLNSFFWRADPLKLRSHLFRLFPAQTGRPLADPLLGHPLSPDGRHLLIIIQPLVSMNDTAGCLALMENLEALEAGLPRGLSLQTAGAHRHTAANARAIETDLVLTLSLAMLLILAIYLFLVRSWGAFWLFLTPAVAVLLAAAGLTLAFPPVSGLALGFGAAVLGIAEDYAVHVHYALRRAPDPPAALSQVAAPLGHSTLICAAGFGVLLFSSVPAIRQLAFFSALAIVAGYAWALIVLPHCPAMDRPREAAAPGRQPFPPPASPDGTRIWAVFSALAGLNALLLLLYPPAVSVRALGLPDPDLSRDQAAIEKVWRLDGGRQILLAEGADLREALELAGLATRELNRREPGSAASLAALLPPPDEQQANLLAWAIFVRTYGPGLKSGLIEAAGREGFEAAAFEPFFRWALTGPGRPVSPDSLRAAGLGPLADSFLAEKGGRHFAVILAEAGARLSEDFDGRIFVLSAAGLEKNLSQALAGEKSLWPLCALLCLALLFRAFRGAVPALLAFLPALGGLTAVLLFQLLRRQPPGLVETAALPLVICLGADYGIVVVSELRARVDLGAPKAIFVSGLSTLAGIGILILADHPVLHALGRTVFVGLAVAMPLSIWLLPRLYRGRKRL